MTERRAFRSLVGAAAIAAACAHSLAGYEVPLAAYAPPTNYYNGATSSVGSTLKGQLATIISTGVMNRGYDTADEAMKLLDVDPNNSSRVILIYNRASASNVWDPNNNVTGWNKEHQWPDSKLSSAANGDLFNLRPCNPPINSNRGNQPFGTTTASGSYGDLGTYWFPGDADKGDVARSMFYIATRWSGHTLVNGAAGGTQEMGDLASLLKFHYTDGVDNFERRRNQYIYGSAGDLTNHALNPSYWQGNRNPYIDHPEYVWAIFGGGNNNSQIYVGGAATADGSSSTTVDLGRVIRDAAMPTGSVTVSKTGANPTTFDVTASGVTTTAASAIPIGVGQPMDYDAVNRTMTLQLSASTSTVGVKSGTVTINNTDLTTSGAGRGSQDGNDTINVTATVVDHSNGSFSLASDVNSQTIDFGYVPLGFANRTAGFAIANLQAASGFTAGLAISLGTPSGSTSFSTNVSAVASLAGGTQNTYTATLSTATAGALSATHAFKMSDEAIPGATLNAGLTLNMTGRVISTATFPVTGTLRLNAGETYDTGAFSIADGVTLTKAGPGAMNVSGSQANGAGSSLAIEGGNVTLGTDAGAAGVFRLNVSTANAGTTLAISSSQHLAGLTIADNTVATVTAGGEKLLVTQALAIGAAGKLDLHDDDAAVIATPGAITGYLRTGWATGNWDGFGILSGSAAADPLKITAIGWAPATILGGTFAGETLDPAAIVLKYTYYGDADLDGVVTINDYALVDRGLAMGSAGWVAGDFDYSGVVDSLDYFALDRAYGLQNGVLSPALLADRESRFGSEYVSQLVTAVPEPALCSGLAAGMLLARRQSRPSRRR